MPPKKPEFDARAEFGKIADELLRQERIAVVVDDGPLSDEEIEVQIQNAREAFKKRASRIDALRTLFRGAAMIGRKYAAGG